MGMFDSVWVNCPHCNDRFEVQSKAGDCMLREYSLEDLSIPIEILKDIEGQHCCEWCQRPVEIEIEYKPVGKVVSRGY